MKAQTGQTINGESLDADRSFIGPEPQLDDQLFQQLKHEIFQLQSQAQGDESFPSERLIEITRLCNLIEQQISQHHGLAKDLRDAQRRTDDLRLRLVKETADRNREREHAAQESRRLRLAYARSEQRIVNIKNTITFRLGFALMNGLKSWQAMRALPAELLRLRKEAQVRRAHKGPEKIKAQPTANGGPEPGELINYYQYGGLTSVLLYLETIKTPSRSVRAANMMEAAKLLYDIDKMDGLELGRSANKLDPKVFRMKWLAFRLYEAGQLTEPMEWLRRVLSSPNLNLKPSETIRAKEIEGQFQILTHGLELPPLGARLATSIPGRIAYIASSVQPFHTSGYTTRTESLVQSLRKQGFDVTVFARPGYPHDRSDVLTKIDKLDYEIGGVPYKVFDERMSRNLNVEEQIQKAADLLVKSFEDFRPSVVHAASDHRNALPALFAARRLGLPFVYEVRGLWEFTTASKHVNWETTERFEVVKNLESLCAVNADALVTLTAFMAEELANRGVDSRSISLAPNCVDASHFQACPMDYARRQKHGINNDDFVIGYAGSLVEYEGLDDLILALDFLRDTLPQARVLIVGDGTARSMLEAQVRQRRLKERVVFVGRVNPKDVVGYIACMDAYAVPRRPERVCHLVSPLKPLEAMAMQKPIIVSNVGGMVGMVENGVTGYVHEAGDFRSLADQIVACARDPQRAKSISLAARKFVENERTWESSAHSIIQAYQTISPMIPDRSITPRPSD